MDIREVQIEKLVVGMSKLFDGHEMEDIELALQITLTVFLQRTTVTREESMEDLTKFFCGVGVAMDEWYQQLGNGLN
jgi:hypothetical protein